MNTTKCFLLAVVSVLCGLVFAASASAQPVLDRVEQLLRDQIDAAKRTPPPAEPGYLGLTGDDTVDAPRGVRVLQVVDGQAAARAGLRAGDLITRIDDRAVRHLDDMAQALNGKMAGSRVTIVATRAGAQQSFNVTLGRHTDAPAAAEVPPPIASPPVGDRPRLGVRSVPLSDDVRRQNNLAAAGGAHVISVAVGSPAERAGIPLGAIITAVDAAPVATPQQLAEAIQNARANAVTLSYVLRGQTARARVELGAPLAAAKPQPQVRARPPLAELPAPSGAAPQAIEKPIVGGDDRIANLEKRIQELEARIKSLEAEKAQPATSPPPQENPPTITPQ